MGYFPVVIFSENGAIYLGAEITGIGNEEGFAYINSIYRLWGD